VSSARGLRRVWRQRCWTADALRGLKFTDDARLNFRTLPVEASKPLRPLMRLWARIRNEELGLLLSVLLIGGTLWAFAKLADQVLGAQTHALDEAVLLALRESRDPNTPIGPVWVREAARDITSLGGTTVLTLLTIATVGFLLLSRKCGAAILMTICVAGGALLSMGLKTGFDRPRPTLVPHAVDVYSASFPSGHAMLATITYLTLGALLARVQPRRRVKAYLLTWAVMLSVLVGASRIYLGVHWPTDVVAGWCMGSAWALLCVSVALRLQRRA
jgi:undecaprenyl-diphosphatase